MNPQPAPFDFAKIKWAYFGLVIGMFTASISQTIVSPAIPRIVADLGGLAWYSWLSTIVMLVSAVITPISGKLADIFGRRRFYIIGLLLFMLGSVLAGMAFNFGFLIFARSVQGMGMGTNELAKELNSRVRPDRLPMQSGLGLCLLAAKAYGKVIVDGVFNAFKDDEGLRAECEQGRDMGFDGKTLIHPAQLAITNQVFAPADADIDLARRQIEAFEAATREGKGVAVVDGKIVENLHVETARKTLALAEAIAEMTE